MSRPPWLLVLAIVLQLCLGSAWARPTAAAVVPDVPPASVVSVASDASAMADMHAHCHEAVSAQAADGTGDQASAHGASAGGSCCGTTHCQLCSVVGLPLQAIAWAPLPHAPNLGRPLPALASRALPPELRPPI